jgi:hypothetical protein
MNSMKTKIFALITFAGLMFLAQLTVAQTQEIEKPEFRTLFQTDSPVRMSGFGGPNVEFSTFGKGDLAVSVGGGGAFLVNNRFYIGGYGQGMATYHYLTDFRTYDPVGKKWTDYSDKRVNFGHGGFWIGGIFRPEDAIHYGISSKIGWGEISLIEDEYHEDRYQPYFADKVFVVTPQIEVEANLARWLKLNVGVGYRFVTGINRSYTAYNNDGSLIGKKQVYKSSDFNSPQANVTFIFGWFW